jgi:hypothetical protein
LGDDVAADEAQKVDERVDALATLPPIQDSFASFVVF